MQESYLKQVSIGVTTSIKAMWLTFKYMFMKPVTIQYPREKREPSARYRGLMKLEKNDDGGYLCIACGACARVCPSSAISVTSTKKEGAAGRVLADFKIDSGLCIHCGLCAEHCPVNGLSHTREYEVAVRDKSQLLERLNK